MTRMTTAIGMALMIAIGAGCGAAQAPQDTLSETVRLYNEDLHWGRFETAATHLPAKQRTARIDEWDERSHDLKVTDFEIVRLDAKNKSTARAQVKLSWYLESEQILRETSALQTWERMGKTWLLVDEERLRGAEMPGLAEPVAHVPETHGSPPPAESR